MGSLESLRSVQLALNNEGLAVAFKQVARFETQQISGNMLIELRPSP